MSRHFRRLATGLQQVLFPHAADCAADEALDQFSRFHVPEREALVRAAVGALNFKAIGAIHAAYAPELNLQPGTEKGIFKTAYGVPPDPPLQLGQ